jgi:hypothetical protein
MTTDPLRVLAYIRQSELFGEVQGCECTMHLNSGSVVNVGSFNRVVKHTKRMLFVVFMDYNSPFLVHGVPRNTLVPGHVLGVDTSTIAEVFGIGCETQIHLSVVEPIPIHMVNAIPRRGIHHKALHHDGFAGSVFDPTPLCVFPFRVAAKTPLQCSDTLEVLVVNKGDHYPIPCVDRDFSYHNNPPLTA